MSRLRAAVFDLDGTLVDSLPLVLRSIAHGIEPFAPLNVRCRKSDRSSIGVR